MAIIKNTFEIIKGKNRLFIEVGKNETLIKTKGGIFSKPNESYVYIEKNDILDLIDFLKKYVKN